MDTAAPELAFSHTRPPEQPLALAFVHLFEGLRPCFLQQRTHQRAMELAWALLCSDHPHTITSALLAQGRTNCDWSADYFLFSRARWDCQHLFDSIFSLAVSYGTSGSVPVAIDDTHLPKWGSRIPGASVLYNPHSLPYSRSLHKAQRFIAASILIAPEQDSGPARGIPVAFHPAPPAKKPKKSAPLEQWDIYRQEAKEKSLSRQGVHLMNRLRNRMDEDPETATKDLVVAVDGSYTNSTVFSSIPQRTILIGRARRDARLFCLPSPYSGIGRRSKYGPALPSPEEIRKDESIPWKTARVYAAGRVQEMEYKTLAPVLWKQGAKQKPLRLVVIRPLAYRPRRGAKLLYREPAYLFVSDPSYPVEKAIQEYVYRWEIEVNHRDEKSIIGVGDPQVRNERSAYVVPQFQVAVYALLLLASLDAYGWARDVRYPPLAKWRKDERPRPSARDLIQQLQRELNQAAIKSFTSLVAPKDTPRPAQNLLPRGRDTVTDGHPEVKEDLAALLDRKLKLPK